MSYRYLEAPKCDLTMSIPILYAMDPSPPSRAVYLTAEAIGLKYEMREVNLLEGDHLKESYQEVHGVYFLKNLSLFGKSIISLNYIFTDESSTYYSHVG